MEQARSDAASHRQPDCGSSSFLRRADSVRRRLAYFREGPVALEARSEGHDLLDRARSARAIAQEHQKSVLGAGNVVCCRVHALPDGAQEILACPNYGNYGDVRRVARPGECFSERTLPLHGILCIRGWLKINLV